MTVFADASAIVKLFLSEAGSDRLADEPGPFAISMVTRVEVASAIWRKARERRVDASLSAVAAADVNSQLTNGSLVSGAEVFEVAMTEPQVTAASRLCGVHALRAGDAIQLATALAVRRVDPSCNRFWVFDRRLADAASREGFAVVGPESS